MLRSRETGPAHASRVVLRAVIARRRPRVVNKSAAQLRGGRRVAVAPVLRGLVAVECVGDAAARSAQGLEDSLWVVGGAEGAQGGEAAGADGLGEDSVGGGCSGGQVGDVPVEAAEGGGGEVGEEPDELVGGHDGGVDLAEVEGVEAREVGEEAGEGGEGFDVHVVEGEGLEVGAGCSCGESGESGGGDAGESRQGEFFEWWKRCEGAVVEALARQAGDVQCLERWEVPKGLLECAGR